ncbi:glycosyltransferase family 4 protein [Fibrella sp. WM1]|uniref:glycosyltransferase family 4 protein n=1 Tax=Fibrella musci TaxID=3242485 RepID=UPI003521C5BA
MKILFITPHGGFTGSEILIWQLMQELHKRGKSVAWFSRKAGALKQQQQEVSFPNQFFPQKQSFLNSFYEGVYVKATGTLPVYEALLRYHREIKPDLWYLNTAIQADVAGIARKLGVPYVVHFQELTSTFDEQKADEFLAMLSGATRLIGCSNIVQQRIAQIGFPGAALLNSFVDHSKIQVRQDRMALRRQVGLPDDAFVWLMSGTESLRKGYDLVPDILTNLPANAYLVWLGKPRDSALRVYVEQRVKHENLRYLALGEHSSDYFDYLNIADGFVLTSREDPHPVVMIEAAALGKPIAAFDSGGVTEFVQPGMGGVVASFNPADLARLMRDIMDGSLPVSAATSQAHASQFSVANRADDFCRIFNL